MKLKHGIIAALCAAAFLGAGAGARAATVTFAATDGGTHSASAVFSITGNGKLKIVLINTSAADTLVPSDLLTGVFWSMAGTPVLSVDKVLIAAGSSANKGSTAFAVTGGVVSGEFAFKATAGAPGPYTGANFSNWAGAQYGVSSSGLSSSGSGDGTFGVPDLFSTVNLDGPASPDGSNFGIASAGDNLATGNGGISGVPIIKNAVAIYLKLPTGVTTYDLTGIGNVWFAYGTSLSDERISPGAVVAGVAGVGVPVPAAVWTGLSALGVLGVVGGWRRRRVS